MFIIILLAMLSPMTKAAVISDSMLMTGYMHVDYFPDKWQQKPQANNTIPTIELNIENYISHHQMQWLTFGFDINSLWSKEQGAPISWEELKVRTSIYTKILPFTHLGYSVKYLTDSPSDADLSDRTQWVHGISIRVAW